MPSLQELGAPARLLIFSLDLDIAFRELLRFCSSCSFVCCNSRCRLLQFDSELLRLCQQAFGLHGRFNAVQNDTNAGGKLIKK